MILRDSYPSPCLTCDGQSCSGGGYGCAEWKTYFFTHWKWIRLKGWQLYRPKPRTENKFIIAHPGEVRRYLQYSPCKGCNAEQECDTPCPAYLRWYDERMEYARKKVGL